MLCSFTLSTVLSCDCEDNSHQLGCASSQLDTISQAQHQATTPSIVMAQVEEIRISMHFTNDKACLLAVFVPPEFLDTSELIRTSPSDSGATSEILPATAPPNQGYGIWRISSETEESMQRLEKWTADVYQRLHPLLSQCKLSIRAAMMVPSRQHPADILLLDVSDLSNEKVSDLICAINGDGIASMPYLVLKVLPIAHVKGVHRVRLLPPSTTAASTSPLQQFSSTCDNNIPMFDVSTCPVCLHRLDPTRLLTGIAPSSSTSAQHPCSDYCQKGCTNQAFLQPWPSPPSSCTACESIRHYWKNATSSLVENDFFCYGCAMQETLWVCLSCGFVGCGRYSQGHAEEHYRSSKHPFSLELATLRIWDYASGEFAHRGDVLQCQFSPPKLHGREQGAAMELGGVMNGVPATASVASAKGARDDSIWQNGDSGDLKGTMGKKNKGVNKMKGLGGASKNGKQQPYSGTFAMLPPEAGHPKKANMIGEEYEALLQSALEDQAQHYEGELSRLRAALTAEQVDQNRVTTTEKRQIDNLHRDISRLRHEVDGLGHKLLEAQAQEAGHRATSQKLLREQGVAKDLLDKIRAEAQKEHEVGKQQVEDLEQQIADLTGNLRMQQQFSQDKELSQAQIFGTTSRASSSPNNNKRGGKKGRRKR